MNFNFDFLYLELAEEGIPVLNLPQTCTCLGVGGEDNLSRGTFD